MSCNRKILFLAAFVICLNTHAFCSTDACRLASRLSLENLRLQLVRLANAESDDYEPNGHDRVQRAFEELIVIGARCSTTETSISAADCRDAADATRRLGPFPKQGFGLFEKITGCKLVQQDQSAVRPDEPLPDPGTLIVRTLRELQESDGEAAYWIADDLLALVLVYPEEVIAAVKADPSFHKQFIAFLRGFAFEDLDDRPGAQHLLVKEKEREYGKLLARLKRKRVDDPERAKILSEMTGADPVPLLLTP